MQQFRFSQGSSSRCTATGSTSSSRVGATSRAAATTAAAAHSGAQEVATASADSALRRQLLQSAAAVAVAAVLPLAASAAPAAGDWTAPGLAAPEDKSLPKFFKTANGVRVQELVVGSGPEVRKGDAVLVDYVLRRANGYFIYGTIEGVSFQPKDVPVGPIRLQLGSGELIEGLETALVGMKQGGKRRVLVPPEVGYVSSVLQPQMPTFATKRQLANHSSEPLLFEVELLRVIS